MEKFATNKNGNIDSGTEVLSNNMVFLQEAKAKAISNLYGDLCSEGILNINMGTSANPILPFELKAGTIAGTFSVGIGIAYKKDVNSGLNERIAILEETAYQDEPFGDSTYPDGRGVNQKTFDGVDSYVDTPKSSGCLNIPIPNVDTEYYVDIRYINVCDNGNDGTGLNLINYSIAKNLIYSSTDQRKRFYKWVDGYNIVLINDLSQQQGVVIGTVQKDGSNNLTFTDTGRANNLLIDSNVFMDYFAAGSGLTIIEEDDKKRLAINVDNVTTEIRDNKVRLTEDALYPYCKFSVNSGHLDSSNEPDILLTDTVGITIYFGVGTQTPLVVSPAYNDKYTILPTDTIDNISSVRDLINQEYSETEGTYTVCVNNKDKSNNEPLEHPKLELMKSVYRCRVVPTSVQKGTIWLDISVEPFRAKWFDGGSWLEYDGVPLGSAEVTNSTITVSSDSFAKLTTRSLRTHGLNIYNDNGTIQRTAYMGVDTNNYLHISNIDGFSLNNIGNIVVDIATDTLDITNFTNVQISGNPIPRLPNYSTKTQVASSTNNTVASWTATANGWVWATFNQAYGSTGDASVFSINNGVIIDANFASASVLHFLGLYPVKKGDVIRVRRGVTAYFYSNR